VALWPLSLDVVDGQIEGARTPVYHKRKVADRAYSEVYPSDWLGSVGEDGTRTVTTEYAHSSKRCEEVV
jgi:hypothetical protein